MKSLFVRLKHFYLYDIKLQYKLLFSHLLLIILPTLVLAFFLYNRLYDTIVSDTILSEQTLAAQTTNTIEATISQIRQASDSLAESDACRRIFSDTAFSLKTNISALEEAAHRLTDGSLIMGIRLYAEDSCEAVFETSDGSLFVPLSNVTGTYWYGIFSSRDVDSLFCPGLYLSVTEEESLGGLAYIRRLDTESGAEAYLSVYFSQARLNTSLGSQVSTDNSAAYLLNERDAVVASSDPILSGAYYMSNKALQELVGGVNQYTTRSYLGDSIYVGYYSIADTDWHLISILSSESLVRKGNALVLQFIAIYALFFLLAMMISLYLSRSVARRIATLSEKMQEVHRGMPVRIENAEESHDEIGELTDSYNYMTNELNRLAEEQARSAEELRIAEFNSLQAQMNPHFLYNTLEMINWMAKNGDAEDIQGVIQDLSRFYKLTLSRRDSISTIGEELEHVTIYTRLQNMRFDHSITFLKDIPENLLSYAIPKLTFQPIVENSILHGILEKESHSGTIVLTGWLEAETVVILISDDGVGMAPEKLSEILSDRGASKTGSHIAVGNIHRRLQILYGSGYGLSCRSVLGKGTEVEIRIPAKASSPVSSDRTPPPSPE